MGLFTTYANQDTGIASAATPTSSATVAHPSASLDASTPSSASSDALAKPLAHSQPLVQKLCDWVIQYTEDDPELLEGAIKYMIDALITITTTR